MELVRYKKKKKKNLFTSFFEQIEENIDEL